MRAARFESLSADGGFVAGLAEDVGGCCPGTVANASVSTNAAIKDRIVADFTPRLLWLIKSGN